MVKKDGHSISEIKAALGNGVADPIIRQMPVTLQYSSGKKIATVSNVVGLVEGSDKKNEYLFVTAHYDHVGMDEKGNIYYGADDDGSGTVSVMKMAEAFAKAKKKERALAALWCLCWLPERKKVCGALSIIQNILFFLWTKQRQT
ncbi:M28 family peptidase [Niabella hibiscisoli]|uniref:M28 family peptidase n=1 Tax=Niabella hibiscisoli TaxID=1825928 RepID=UPI00293EE5B0|nr:M28 family peptidase [Niabella hibiscisoli]